MRKMLGDIRSHASMVSKEEAALAAAEQEAAQMRQEIAGVDAMRDELEDRVRQAMAVRPRPHSMAWRANEYSLGTTPVPSLVFAMYSSAGSRTK